MKRACWRRGRQRPLALLAATAAVGGLIASAPQTAGADTAPAAGVPTTVAANGLPTMQVNGIVWAQVTVGNTVYATGNFTKARPAGSPVGQNETPVGNIVAYDITTGKMITSFIHTMNNQGLSLAATPDGKTIYVGGDFTAVDGKTRNHVAAFSTATGALVSNFAPYVGSNVRAIVATNSIVYVGGSFNTAGGQPRSNLAAFTSTSALTGWAPVADDIVQSMVMSPDKSRIIIGGRFYTLNHNYAAGMGAVDATSGAQLTWRANGTIIDYGSGGASIDGLSTDGKLIYGAGVAPGGAGYENFEGRFAADPSDGHIVWLDDCHGDSYATLPLRQVLYSTSHAHDCSAVGSFPDYFPKGEDHHRTLAETTYPDGTNTGPDSYSWNFNGVPKADVLDWFPKLTAAAMTAPAGTVAVSGSGQAGWALATDPSGTYLAVGGEFTAVNNTAQQALTRFAMPSLTKDGAGNPNNTSGPESSSITQPSGAPGTTLGSAIVTFTAAWDRDNQNLTYNLYRDGGTTSVASTKIASTFWQLPTGTLTDTTASPGTHTYVVKVSDPFGNTRSYPPVTTQAAGVTSALVYSTDGGKTWTTTPTVAKGATVLVRQYYNNTTGQAFNATSAKTTLPTGFTRVANTTSVCLNPGTTDPTHPTTESSCNTSAGQSGAITDSAVWSGSNLTISPTAGLFAQPASATSGELAMGKKGYVTVDQCQISYTGGVHIAAIDQDTDLNGTYVGNTGTGTQACSPSIYLTSASASSHSLLGQRYLNLDVCTQQFSGVHGGGAIDNDTTAAGTTTGNIAIGTSNCPAGNIYQTSAWVQNLDLLSSRYIHVAQCVSVYQNGIHGSIVDQDTSTNGSVADNSASDTANCSWAGQYFWYSSNITLDTLDQNRGQGYVQFTMKAPATAGTVTQTATITNGFAPAKATIKVS